MTWTLLPEYKMIVFPIPQEGSILKTKKEYVAVRIFEIKSVFVYLMRIIVCLSKA